MGIIRPATPGFLVTLIATGLLAVVTFSVPYIKSIYFLKASLSIDNESGSLTFGTLGYCLQLPNGTTCSKPSVGYELDVNSLLGDNSPIQIPNVVVKWVTYALVLHIVALILSALAAFFGLLAHVREMSMAYCSSFVSGFAASVALVAFIFDLVLFFLTKDRIDSVSGASASIGVGVWLTLAAWLLLFFAGCFYGFGRCCIKRRPDRYNRNGPSVDAGYAEQMRLDAVKAEADRKARQKQGEIGLPAFQELEQMQPLARTVSDEYVEDGDKIVPLSDVQTAGVGTYNHRQASQSRRDQYPGGYSQGPVGSRAVDAYYNPSPAQSSIYPPQSPPQPQRQPSAHSQGASGYTPSAYSYGSNAAPAQYTAMGAYGHSQQPTTATSNYGHGATGSSYYQAPAPVNQQYQTNFSMPRSNTYAVQNQRSFNADTYNNTGYMGAGAGSSSAAVPSNSYARTAAAQPDRSYTLGGAGYGGSNDAAYYDPYAAASSHHSTPSPAPINTGVAPAQNVASPRGPRTPAPLVQSPIEGIPEPEGTHYTDNPPMYDEMTAQPPGMWSTKR
ncbi:uncharacterized protein FIBRA_00104 [Fibroporia radiculosa]|uniref:Pali-domain-containing protein n=1 Tax=Fibroporia radiculosa TaxID=599839 RepID=J7RUW0_9APHY|nr:uncharacterized protein FIBRA_00104 [Fibroporia radiculosa]CCL98110.1 predicted protein [Fibroporia radiculosa]